MMHYYSQVMATKSLYNKFLTIYNTRKDEKILNLKHKCRQYQCSNAPVANSVQIHQCEFHKYRGKEQQSKGLSNLVAISSLTLKA
jgi:hypothetical protein